MASREFETCIFDVVKYNVNNLNYEYGMMFDPLMCCQIQAELGKEIEYMPADQAVVKMYGKVYPVPRLQVFINLKLFKYQLNNFNFYQGWLW